MGKVAPVRHQKTIRWTKKVRSLFLTAMGGNSGNKALPPESREAQGRGKGPLLANRRAHHWMQGGR